MLALLLALVDDRHQDKSLGCPLYAFIQGLALVFSLGRVEDLAVGWEVMLDHYTRL